MSVRPNGTRSDHRRLQIVLRYPSSNSSYPFVATSSHRARYAGALPLYRAIIRVCFPSTFLLMPVIQELISFDSSPTPSDLT